MRGLTILVAGAEPARLRAALATAGAAAALGQQVRVFLHEEAVALLAAEDTDATRLAAAGLPDRAALLALAEESGVALLLCQSGLALAGMSIEDLAVNADAGGLVSLLAELGEDRLVTF